MSQTQQEQIVNLIDEHFNKYSVMSESDYNSILHYVDLGDAEPEAEF